jgi:hypothetical protein
LKHEAFLTYISSVNNHNGVPATAPNEKDILDMFRREREKWEKESAAREAAIKEAAAREAAAREAAAGARAYTAEDVMLMVRQEKEKWAQEHSAPAPAPGPSALDVQEMLRQEREKWKAEATAARDAAVQEQVEYYRQQFKEVYGDVNKANAEAERFKNEASRANADAERFKMEAKLAKERLDDAMQMDAIIDKANEAAGNIAASAGFPLTPEYKFGQTGGFTFGAGLKTEGLEGEYRDIDHKISDVTDESI